ncbi:uncharacterized protein STEHIDRAFT_133766 [Stereum hirsutum FP-91666 SS1]|uniref:uncharacterized protein n=1 Tax=Stereum hirsutum (strain FP-91666) TaxID=721885 RepID=UPI0004449B22|nr:uncharacterized protein STEHIDRAFT_133766 [Stereum hirsutum FP-91666 SS1]EIM82983.1 hypothetical protein STEHIDRAFT_133766 [Stereum hirsutum FP-91666 SS1]
MESPLPPLPASGTYMRSIRDSCRLLRESHNIHIAPSSIQRLLLSEAFSSTYHRISKTSHGLAFPLKFPSALAELNLLSILSLLNIASGYRVPLHQQTGRGAWDSIRAFVFGLYLSSSIGADDDLLSAKGMRSISETKIVELMGVSVHVERPHESIPGVTVGEVGGPIHELVQLLKTLMNETGNVLVNGGYTDLGSFVLEALKEGEKATRQSGDKTAAAEVVLERLVRAIPGFRDMAIVNEQPVYCFKKALFLIHGVSIRFGSSSPSSVPIPETSHLPVFTDNVLPSILVHLGVLDLTQATQSLISLFPGAGSEECLMSLLATAPSDPPEDATKMNEKPLPKEGPILTTEQSYILRAAAIDACELIVEYSRSMDTSELQQLRLEWVKDITLPDLDMWLWAVAKDRKDYRELERFVLRNTLFF